MMKMNKTFPIVVGALCFSSFVVLSVLPTGAQHRAKRKITDAEIRAVIQAVEDEIYDYGYEEEYSVVDAPACGPRSSATCIRIYINPEINADETGGEVIYKLMPYGEVFRDYGILDSGLAVLSGDPHNEFNPTDESARKTVYMDEDTVLRMKQDWLKYSFDVDASVNDKTIDAAAQRQKLRTGFSHWQYAQSLKKKRSK
jgi:hypothetical protein